MKTILRQLILLLMGFTLWYSGMYAVSIYVIPDSKYIDVGLRTRSLYYSDLGILSLDISRLQENNNPKIIILGASNAIRGLRPAQLQQYFPDYEVANLAIPGARIEDMRRTLELVRDILPDDVYRQSVFIAGIWYGDFFEKDPINRVNFDTVLLDTGLYRQDGNRITPVVPPEYFHTVVKSLRPYYFWNYIRKSYKLERMNPAALLARLNSDVPDSPEVSKMTKLRKKTSLTAKDKQWLANRMLPEGPEHPPELSTKRLQEMLSLCEYVSDSGSHLVLVDLPLPEWHKESIPTYKEYESVKWYYYNRALELPNVYYINLLNDERASDESLFMDLTHPRPQAAKLWSRLLAEQWPVP